MGNRVSYNPLGPYKTWRERDFAQGRCSGFPDCCIEFFTDYWIPNIGDRTMSDPYHRALDAAGHPHYIPCPDCLQNRNFVQVRDCYPGCDCGLMPPGGKYHIVSNH